jgi:hypothetical protein
MLDDVVIQLRDGPRFAIRDLAAANLPRQPGIYALWHANLFLYVGIARIDPKDTKNPQAAGVPGRLHTYRRCRLTSDFAIACAFRFVVPDLTNDQRRGLAAGDYRVSDIQGLVQSWVLEHVEFSAVIVDATTASAAERHVRTSGLPGLGRPTFNPL